MKVLALMVAVFAMGCGSEAVSTLDGAWTTTVEAFPVFVDADTTVPAPAPYVTNAALLAETQADSTLVLNGLCPLAGPLTLKPDVNGHFYLDGPSFTCGVGYLPAYSEPLGRDEWNACDEAMLYIHNLDLSLRDGHIFGEGGATIQGCGREWRALVHLNATRVGA